MECSKVKKCEVSDCAYNMDSNCHAMAITIGDSSRPKCDTFCKSAVKGGDASFLASVGACKVSICKFNNCLECQAPGIMIGYQDQEPDCLTFKAG